jgi:MFS superfamily sulfate permease-like transporter
LVFTGFKLLSPAALRKLRAHGWGEVAIYFVTIGAIVATNLLEGILIGLGLALLKQLWTLSHLASTLNVSPDGRTAELTLHGAATFVGLPRLAAKLEQVPAGAELHLNVSQLAHIDHACLDMLADWEKQHATAGGRLVVDWNSLTGRPQERRPATSSQLAGIR